ncbi:AAA family ATPase [Candidatus Fermentibacteria bacterium]|nr:AAA family ATPase [Candidatus Fermentibacteria bacterium]
MYRETMEKLKEWKASTLRKPLIIRGARQTGKTWLMRTFGSRYYDSLAYINLESNPEMQKLFQMDFDVQRILLGLQVEAGFRIAPEETLVVLDEIQESPEALSSLKYFHENAPEYHIMAAGSMLGVTLHSEMSFPVGKVQFLDLHPMSFPEFLLALEKDSLYEIVTGPDFKMLKVFSEKLTELLKRYYFIGGMPGVVKEFRSNPDFSLARDIQKQLLTAYEQDFSKHVPHPLIPRIRGVWNSLPAQLARENKKFIYGLVRKGARAREYELAIQWLIDCGLSHRVSRITKPGIPLAAYLDQKAFKLFAPDVGLLCAMTDIDQNSVLEGNSLFSEFKGALTEQFVLQQLIVSGDREPYYWSGRSSSAEVDFVLQQHGNVLPLEVKAAENLQSKSLKSYFERFAPPKALRASLSGYREEDWLINIPLYAINSIHHIVENL